MTIKLLAIGKTDSKLLQQMITEYENRLKHYIGFELHTIPDLKNIYVPFDSDSIPSRISMKSLNKAAKIFEIRWDSGAGYNGYEKK